MPDTGDEFYEFDPTGDDGIVGTDDDLIGIIPITCVTGTSPCTLENTRYIDVRPQVNASLEEEAVLCFSDSGNFNLEGLYGEFTDDGGVFYFTGNDIQNDPSGSFNNNTGSGATGSIAGANIYYNEPGTYTITYDKYSLNNGDVLTPPDDGVCFDSDDAVVLIYPELEASFDFPDVICASSGSVNVEDYVSSPDYAGLWNGNFAAADQFTIDRSFNVPTNVTPPVGGGILTIEMTEQIIVGGTVICEQTVSEVVEVLPDVDSSWALPANPICADFSVSQVFDLTTFITGDTGGTWSGENVTSAGSLTVTSAGDYTVTYTVGESPCSESTSITIIFIGEVTNGLTAQTFCVTDISNTVDLDILLSGGTTLGGTFALSGAVPAGTTASVSGDALNYVITDGGAAGNYTFSIDYTVGTAGAAAACATNTQSTTLTIAYGNAVWDGPSSFCMSEMSADLTSYFTGSTTTTGTFTIIPDNGNLTGAGVWDLSSETAGLYEVTWTLNGGNSCDGESHTEIIAVTDCSCTTPIVLPVAGACACSGGDVTIDIPAMSGGVTGNYILSALGGTLGATDGSATTLTLNEGEVSWAVLVSDGEGCSEVLSGSCDMPLAPQIVGASGPYCQNDPEINLTVSPLPTGVVGTFTSATAGAVSDNFDNTATLDPAFLSAGVHTITYTIAADASILTSCEAYTATFEVEILPSFVPSFTLTSPACIADFAAAQTLSLDGTTAVDIATYAGNTNSSISAEEMVIWYGDAITDTGVEADFAPMSAGTYTVCVLSLIHI